MVSLKDAEKKLSKQLKMAGIEDAKLEANLLIELTTGVAIQKNRTLLETLLTEAQQKKLEILCEERMKGVPIQYLFGKWPFLDFEVEVGTGVLIPRQDTEVVCQQAIALGSNMTTAPTCMVDLCSGSGVIAIALAKAFPNAEVAAVEYEEGAFAYLQKNTRKLASIVKPIKADVFFYQDELVPETVDMITANPPYLAREAMQVLQREVAFEPPTALNGGEDGLVFYKHIIPAYKNALKQNGVLVLEIGFDQKGDVEFLCKAAGYKQVGSVQDYSGNDRCVWAMK